MLMRIRQPIVRPWIRRPKGAAFVTALLAALSTSSAFAQCRGGSGGAGGSGGTGGTGGTAGTGLAGFGAANGSFAATGQGQSGHGWCANCLFAVPANQMFQPIVDDNRQYLAERRALRAAKVEQARQRLASRKEKPARHRFVAVNLSQE